MLQLKMYPAKNGDAFLIRRNSMIPRAVLIDGGYASTFHEYIFHDLKRLAQLGYSIDLVVATHIDADHIAGLLAFFKRNGKSSNPRIIEVKKVWHNCLRSLSLPSLVDDTPNTGDIEILDEIQRRGYPIPTDPDIGPREVSARQGSSLAALLLDGEYNWNNGNGTQSINSSNSSNIGFDQDFQIRIIGPAIRRLEQLHHQWLAELQQIGFSGQIGTNGIFDDAFEFLCAYKGLKDDSYIKPCPLSISTSLQLDDVYSPDESVTNASSISLIIEIGNSHLLFLGDSWAEDANLALLSSKNVTYPRMFDVIKISHHGSLHNTNTELLQIIDAPNYLISANYGKHKHPDIEVLKAIVDRPANFRRNLYFNYATSTSKQMRNYASRSGSLFSIHEEATDWIEIN